MTGQPPPSPQPPKHPLEEVSPALFRQRLFWLRLAAYRPVLIVVGLWLACLAIATVAYSRLIYTGKPAPPRAAQSPQPSAAQVYPHQDPTRTPSPSTTTPPSTEPFTEGGTPENATTVEGDGAIVPSWSLVVLVSTCVLGCLMVSRQIQAPPRRRSPRVQRPAPTPREAKPAPAAPIGPKRLVPYTPGQPVVSAAVPSQPAQPSPPPAPAQPNDAQPAAVSVVAAEDAHPLDWPEGSLIHEADIRQTRSLSSFL